MSSITAEAIVARVRAHARLQAAWTERLWKEGETSPDQGLAIAPGEVRRILTDPDLEEERYRKFVGKEGATLLAESEAERALDASLFWSGIAETFGLTERERDLLCLAVALELEPKLVRVLAYMADDTRVNHPTAAMAAGLFGRKDGGPGPMTGLLRWRLAQPLNGEAAWRPSTAWQVDEAVVLSVLAERWVDPSLERIARLIEPEQASKLPSLYPEVLAQMLDEQPGFADREIEIALTGPPGSGRETLAAHFAAAMGRPLLSVKAAGTPADALVRAVRLAWAMGALVHWREAEGVPAADWMEVRSLARLNIRGSLVAPSTATHQFALQPLSTAQRVMVWAHYSDAAPPSILWTQRLTPAEVKLASRATGDAELRMALQRAVPTQGELLQPVPCPYTWDDLVLPPDVRKTLQDFEAQVRLRWNVYEEWGFGRLTHLGKGISALFGGPSGTGKTMAAQVLARSLELELYRVDLAGVVNKYIGETEKRLRDVFDACERSGALLFFDEADALFGSRTQVKDSHDRFANIEIDYLLQRIEQFDGIAILATNRKNDMDSAFLRRLRFVVEFLNPAKEQRLALWEKALPAFSPSGERILGEIDFRMLAEDLELNGAQIKSIALGAAFLARSAGTRIGMEQIRLATEREYAKQGLRVREPFGKAAL